MKYTRWLQWQRRPIVVLTCVLAMAAAPVAMLSFAFYASAQSAGSLIDRENAARDGRTTTQTDAILPSIGGGGGGQFVTRCPDKQLLTGVELRTGDDVDAIRPLCVSAYGPRETSPPVLTKGSGLKDLGVPSLFGPTYVVEAGWYGGPGGGLGHNLICPKDAPVVIGMYVRAEGVGTIIVNNIQLWCGPVAATQSPGQFPSAVFDGPDAHYTSNSPFGNHLASLNDKQFCPSGLVGAGINGRSGIWLDSVGLICGPPTLTPSPKPVVKLVGRATLSPGATPGPQRSICELAREARARNSPAAKGLEAQCRAAGADGERTPVKLVERTKLSEDATPAPPKSICDLASEARARKSPAAAGLGEQCRADLAAKGAAIAQVDGEVAEGRMAKADAQYQLGFDIATGIFGDPALGAMGTTETGPGSLAIRNSLSTGGQRGFDASVKLHLSRNYKQ